MDIFYVGCPVLVKVAKVDMAQKKMVLNLERLDLALINQGASDAVAMETQPEMASEEPGSVVNCVVVRHSPRGALVCDEGFL